MANYSSSSEYLNGGLRLLAPYVVLLLLFILNMITVSVPLSGSVKAPFMLMAVYYWSIFRPSITPLWLLFIIGMLMDLLGGLPPGLTAIVFVAAGWQISSQRRFFMAQPFIMIWFGFVIISMICVAFQWLIHGLLYPGWPSLKIVALSTIYGTVLFPPICFILHRTNKILVPQKKSMRFSSKK